MPLAEQWESLKKELRQDADREIAATTNQGRKDTIRAELTAFVRLAVPTTEYELNGLKAAAKAHRAKWASSAMDGRMRDELFGKL